MTGDAWLVALVTFCGLRAFRAGKAPHFLRVGIPLNLMFRAVGAWAIPKLLPF